MLGTEIELLISDFDGTLVDTFSANYMAYQKAFAEQGLCLSESQYRACFGLRFDEFMREVSVVDMKISSRIQELKSMYYPSFLIISMLIKHYYTLLKCFIWLAERLPLHLLPIRRIL